MLISLDHNPTFRAPWRLVSDVIASINTSLRAHHSRLPDNAFLAILLGSLDDQRPDPRDDDFFASFATVFALLTLAIPIDLPALLKDIDHALSLKPRHPHQSIRTLVGTGQLEREHAFLSAKLSGQINALGDESLQITYARRER